MQKVTISCGVWNALCEVFTIDSAVGDWWYDKPEVELNYHSYGMETELDIPEQYRFTLPSQADLFLEYAPSWNERNTIYVEDDQGNTIDEFLLSELHEQQRVMFRREEGKGGMAFDMVLKEPYCRDDFKFLVKQFDGSFSVIPEVYYAHDEDTYRWQELSMRSVGSWVWIAGG
jgi:hypothetical protein